jgi:hypothetical protein
VALHIKLKLAAEELVVLVLPLHLQQVMALIHLLVHYQHQLAVAEAEQLVTLDLLLVMVDLEEAAEDVLAVCSQVETVQADKEMLVEVIAEQINHHIQQAEAAELVLLVNLYHQHHNQVMAEMDLLLQ